MLHIEPGLLALGHGLGNLVSWQPLVALKNPLDHLPRGHALLGSGTGLEHPTKGLTLLVLGSFLDTLPRGLTPLILTNGLKDLLRRDSLVSLERVLDNLPMGQCPLALDSLPRGVCLLARLHHGLSHYLKGFNLLGLPNVLHCQGRSNKCTLGLHKQGKVGPMVPRGPSSPQRAPGERRLSEKVPTDHTVMLWWTGRVLLAVSQGDNLTMVPGGGCRKAPWGQDPRGCP
jgi:hypothetical protein